MSLAVVLAVFWIGVAGFKVLVPDTSLLDAVYMVATTLFMVGYREVYETTPAVMAWTIIFIIFGITAMLVALSSFTGLIVEGEVGRLMGSRKLESRIKKLENHVIVCGFGRMGRLLVQRLMEEKVPLVVIENDQNACRQIEKLGQLYVLGDATEEESLDHAGISQARHLVAVLPSDADNVFVTMTARQMRPDLNIVARAEQSTSEPKLRRAGANRVMSPQAIGAERIANILIRPHIVDFAEAAARGVDLEMDEFVVGQDSPLAGKSLRDSNIRRTANVMVVAIRRADGSTAFNPGPDEVVRPRDALITIGPAGASSRLAEIRIIQEENPAQELAEQI